MEWKRMLRKGMRGDDVLLIKTILVEQGILHAATHDTFGDDTKRAVKNFQRAEGLPVSGTVDLSTWNALVAMHADATAVVEAVLAEEPETAYADTPEASEEATEPVTLVEPSTKALMLCTLALERVGDIYVWGASGVTDLSDAYIRAKDTEYARAIKFRDAQRKAGVTGLMAHDCSGFISFLLRQVDAWDNRRDCDGLWSHCDEIRRAELIAGDFLFRHESGNPSNKTHVGLYIGRGRAVHSKGRDVGVVVEGVNEGGSGYWHLYGRCGLLYANGTRGIGTGNPCPT